MSTTTQAPEPAVVTSDVDMVTTLDIGPGNLDRYLDLVGDRRNPLIKYREGSLTLVSPSGRHEVRSDRADGLIKGICAVLNIGYKATASTLFRRPGSDNGIEADKSYYIENEPAVRGLREEIDLAMYPPPDLAVEIVVSHGAGKSLTIYTELRVPEVWVYRVSKRVLEFLHLGADGRYTAAATSRAFPFLTPADVLPWIEPTVDEPDNAWESRLRTWVRDVLAPRR
jgi:Uma2 family endonuclease